MNWFGNLFSSKKRTDLKTKLALQDEDGWWRSAPTSSGVQVNPKAALGYDPFWRGISLIAGDVSGLKMDIFRRVGEGKEKARQHPSYKLLRRKPNPDMTWRVFAIQMQVEALIYGNAYALIQFKPRGDVERLDPVRFVDINPERNERGALFYRLTQEHGGSRDLAPRHVFHLRGISEVSDEGIDLVNNARESLGVGIAAERYGGRFFKNQARPGTVLVHPDVPDEEARNAIRDQWKKGFTGDNQHNVAVLFEGMDVKTIDSKNNEAQFIETINQRVRAVANFLGVPASALGYEGTRTSYASLEAEQQSYLRNTLDPWLRAWEEESWDKLLTPSQQDADSHTIEFNRRQIVNTSLTERFQAYNTALTAGWLNPNEVRSSENMNPIPGGDIYRQQMQMVDINDEPDPEPEPDDTDNNDDDNRRHLETILLQAVTRNLTRLKNSDHRGQKLDSQKNLSVFIEAVEPVFRAMGLYCGSSDLFSVIVRDFDEWKTLNGVQLRDKMLKYVQQNLEPAPEETSRDTPQSSMTERQTLNSVSVTGELNELNEEHLTVS